MTADGVHGNIEKRLKQVGQIYDFQDLVHAVQTSRANMDTIQMESRDFLQWKSQKRPLSGTILHPIVAAKFEKGKRTVEIKSNFDEEAQTLDFLKKKFPIEPLPDAKPSQRGLCTKKNRP